MRNSARVLGCTFAALLFCATSATAQDPDVDGAAGLLSDLERIVAAEEVSWFVDREEYREMYPTVLESVCRATPQARSTARATLEEKLRGLPDPRASFEREGQFSAEAEQALFLIRQKRALEMAIEGADAECPFWVRPEPRFIGRQTDRLRFTLSLETGGLAQIRQTADTWTIGGGGYGRLLPGYGFGNVSLLVGPEFGGGAMLRPGVSPSQFVINYMPAIPVVVRFRRIEWHYDFEVAPVGLFQADDPSVSYGIRGGMTVGVSALRARDFLPWAGLAIAYEHYFPSGGRPRAHFLRGGLRVGVRWDP